MDDSEKSGEFKVSDKRRFTSEGAPKEDAGGEAEIKKPAQEAGTQKAPEPEPEPKGAKRETPERAEQRELPPVDFSHFILGLANTALYQLGLVPDPESGQPQKDLLGARQTIDIVAMLEEKTRGNLNDQEKKILTETLFQLRMAFVEASK